MATYRGDFNLDGVVNDLDLNIFKGNAGIGTTWQMGDANYDGVVNGLDFDLWKANVGLPSLAGDSPGDPAPAESPSLRLALLAAGLLGLLAYAWQKSR